MDRPGPPGVVSAGQDRRSATNLTSLFYDELRRLAERYFAGEPTAHTLQPTALVHEAFLRLRRQDRVTWRNREHFLALAATSMRRVLVDHARRRQSAKRGAAAPRISLDQIPEQEGSGAVPASSQIDVLALHEALEELARIDPFKARIIELRFFAGLSIDETAGVLDCSVDTLTRHWRTARAWLARRLTGA